MPYKNMIVPFTHERFPFGKIPEGVFKKEEPRFVLLIKELR